MQDKPGKPAMATLKAGVSAGRLRFNLLYSAFLIARLGGGWIWVALHSFERSLPFPGRLHLAVDEDDRESLG